MKRPIKAYLLDDEPAIPDVLTQLFSLYTPEVRVVGASTDWDTALQEIPECKPDVLFLDIRMPRGSGFDFLANWQGDRPFEVVFVTGYDEHALDAFRTRALDYLVKPVDHQELIQTVRRLDSVLGSRLSPDPLDAEPPGFLLAHAGEEVVRIPESEILYLQADENYTHIVTLHQGRLVIPRTLKDFESRFEGRKEFLRINRSVIIHTGFLGSYAKTAPFSVTLSDGTVFGISRRRKTDVIRALTRL